MRFRRLHVWYKLIKKLSFFIPHQILSFGRRSTERTFVSFPTVAVTDFRIFSGFQQQIFLIVLETGILPGHLRASLTVSQGCIPSWGLLGGSPSCPFHLLVASRIPWLWTSAPSSSQQRSIFRYQSPWLRPPISWSQTFPLQIPCDYIKVNRYRGFSPRLKILKLNHLCAISLPTLGRTLQGLRDGDLWEGPLFSLPQSPVGTRGFLLKRRNVLDTATLVCLAFAGVGISIRLWVTSLATISSFRFLLSVHI